MRCSKLRRIYLEHIDGLLSDRESRIAEKHIRDCPDCAVEVKSLERMRSLLQTADKVEMPDEYWDTYWARLESKLPDKPSPVGAMSRMSSALVDMLRQPAVLGRVAVYVLLVGFVIYATTDRLPKVVQKAPMSEKARKEFGWTGTTETASQVAESEKGAKAEEKADLGRPLAGSRLRSDSPLPKAQASRGLAVRATEDDRDALAPESEPLVTAGLPARTKEMSLRTRPTTLATAPLEKMEDARGVVESEDEYVAAEAFFNGEEYPKAIKAYQNFIEANLDDSRALRATYQVGEAYYQMGDYSEALANFVAVTDAETPESHERKRNNLRRSDESDRMTVLAPAPGKPGDTKAKRSVSGNGIVVLGSLAQQDKDIPVTREVLISRAIFRQAQSYENLKKHEEALATYKKYVDRYPQGEYLPQAKQKTAQPAR